MGSVWRPSISHCVLLGSSGKQFPCLWKIRETSSSTTKQDILWKFQLEHLIVYDPSTTSALMAKNGNRKLGFFSVSLRALWIVTRLKLRRKVPYISLLEEMLSSCSCGGAFVNWMCPTRLKIALTRPFKTDHFIYSFFSLTIKKALLEFPVLDVFVVFLPQKLCGNTSVFPTTPSKINGPTQRRTFHRHALCA